MRVTNNTFPDRLVDQLGKLSAQQARIQSQAATGQRIEMAEDDPAAVRRILSRQAESKSLNQYQQNITTLQEQAGTVMDTLKGLKKVSDRAGEIATLTDGTKLPADLKNFANEVTQLIQHAVELANSKHRDDYLFAGTKSGQQPFTVTTDADGWVTGVVYHGNSEVSQSEIGPNDPVAVNMPGANASGSGAKGLLEDNRSGVNFIQHLIDLQNHLRDGKAGDIMKTDRTNLSADEDNFLYHVASNASLQARLEAASTQASSRSMELDNSISKDMNVDIAQTIINLNQTQYAYQAALQSGANLLNKSLLDYLR